MNELWFYWELHIRAMSRQRGLFNKVGSPVLVQSFATCKPFKEAVCFSTGLRANIESRHYVSVYGDDFLELREQLWQTASFLYKCCSWLCKPI